MIPKVIHYCWFGGNPLPELAVKCIESWKKYCPDYEIKEWNESNFDLNCCTYVREAYKAKKWAFVSDYVRFWILYHEGGVYFDTDVELIKPIDDIIKKGSFMACEKTNEINWKTNMVAPGLGLAANPGLGLYKEMLNFYEKRHFLNKDGTYDTTTIVVYTTDLLRKYGLRNYDKVQIVNNIQIYPPEYFCPMDYQTGEIVITSNTRSIHHYSASWFSKTEKLIVKIGRVFLKYGQVGHIAERLLTFPLRVWNKIQKLGIKGTINFSRKKINIGVKNIMDKIIGLTNSGGGITNPLQFYIKYELLFGGVL